MRNIRLQIEYEGTRFCGWQVQKQKGLAPSIQETIEKVLGKLTQGRVRLFGSGRTDAGVHALGQVAHFKTAAAISCEKLKKALNALLPETIAVTDVTQVSPDFHSRFKAKSKVYRYTVLHRKVPSVFLRDTAYQVTYPLNIRLIRKESKALVGRHDFRAFCASGSGSRSTVRAIKRISVHKNKDTVLFDIEADGFLYTMVRSIVGTLLEIGRGRFPAGSLKKVLKEGKRSGAGPTAPAKGLCLVEVKY